MHLSRHHTNSKAGFTLVELMVVIVLIGIMTAVILPGMKGTLEAELLNSTSRQLVSALRNASNQSITLNVPHRVRFDSSHTKFMIERRAPITESETGYLPAKISGNRGEMDSRIRIEIHEQELELDENEDYQAESDEAEEQIDLDHIQFNTDGTAQRREIRLRDRMGFGIALRINPITSRIKIVELEREL